MKKQETILSPKKIRRNYKDKIRKITLVFLPQLHKFIQIGLQGGHTDQHTVLAGLTILRIMDQIIYIAIIIHYFNPISHLWDIRH